MNNVFPNVEFGKGKLRKAVIQSLSSFSMSASASAQNEIDIPQYGDLVGVEIALTQSTTGTLTGGKTLEKALKSLTLKDRSGRNIWSQIRGQDLPQIDRMLNTGRSRTVATTSSSAQTHRFLIPWNIEQKDMPARFQVTIAPYSDMATSGATGGSVTLEVTGYYQDQSEMGYTQRITRISQSITSGLNRFAPNLPKDVAIQGLLFSIGTESNLTHLDFSADGRAELSTYKPSDMQAIEDVRMISGHVTGQFDLYCSPFVSDTKTILDITASGSDTIEWFVIMAD